MNNKGQFSIIAALLVAVILIATVMMTYSTIRNSPIQNQPQVLSAVDETNLAIKQILGFTVGYYGSVLKVTGNSSYAKTLALGYLHSGLVNIGSMHPEWGASFNVSDSELYTYWFTNASYSMGDLAVNYSLTGLGIYGITYDASCKLTVQVENSTATNQTQLIVTKDDGEPLINLGKQNFKFYRYLYANSTWELVNPSSEPVAYANGTYEISIPSGIDPYSYVIQVEDSRGIVVVASSFSRYTCTLSWNSTLYSTLQNATLVAELLQNGTIRWLGQNIQLTTQAKPVPPIPVKTIHINQTINSVNLEVPFQIEDWSSEYSSPLGLTNNASVFSSKTMLVFLITPNVSKVVVWWNGSDTATQTPSAYVNQYFTKDDPINGVLTNEKLGLILQGSYLYVDGFDRTSQFWSTSGASPYLNDETSNYISNNGDNEREGWFTFQDLTSNHTQALGSAEIKAPIRIEFDCKRSGSDDYFDFRINDGTTTYQFGSITPPNDYDWRSYDISSVINTSAQINNAKVEVRYRQSGSGASTVSIRRCRIFIDFWLTSVTNSTSAKADFMRINDKNPTYGSNLAYTIHHGIVRDVIQQEAEWSGGIPNCPNVYSHIVITLPANVTFYTYQLRLMFVDSQQNRNIASLCPIKLTTSGQPQTENGTTVDYPIVSSATGSFYNYSGAAWAHHWSQFISGTKGAGIMFTDLANQKLYVFDQIAGTETGALRVSNTTKATIELLPAVLASVSFTYALDVTWNGAVVTFDGTTPIYKEEGGNNTGLWITVERPPTIAVNAET